MNTYAANVANEMKPQNIIIDILDSIAWHCDTYSRKQAADTLREMRKIGANIRKLRADHFEIEV